MIQAATQERSTSRISARSRKPGSRVIALPTVRDAAGQLAQLLEAPIRVCRSAIAVFMRPGRSGRIARPKATLAPGDSAVYSSRPGGPHAPALAARCGDRLGLSYYRPKGAVAFGPAAPGMATNRGAHHLEGPVVYCAARHERRDKGDLYEMIWTRHARPRRCVHDHYLGEIPSRGDLATYAQAILVGNLAGLEVGITDSQGGSNLISDRRVGRSADGWRYVELNGMVTSGGADRARIMLIDRGATVIAIMAMSTPGNGCVGLSVETTPNSNTITWAGSLLQL